MEIVAFALLIAAVIFIKSAIDCHRRVEKIDRMLAELEDESNVE